MTQPPLYIYIGQRQGRVNYNRSGILNPQILSASPNRRVIYHEDRVWARVMSREGFDHPYEAQALLLLKFCA